MLKDLNKETLVTQLERKSIILNCNVGLKEIKANLLSDPDQVKHTKLMFTDQNYRRYCLNVWLKRGYELYRVRNRVIEWDRESLTFRLVPKVTIDTLVATTNVTKNKFKWLVDETLVGTKTLDLGNISKNE